MIRWFFRLAARFMYTCRRTSEHYTHLAEGALPAEDAAKMRSHLKICPGCKAFRSQMETVALALKSAPEEAVTREDRERLVETFRARKA